MRWILGGGSLWLYAPYPASEMVTGSGELLRISEQIGRVQQRWPMPSFPRALLAVDADGLWIAPSAFSGTPIKTPATRLIPYESLYRVAAGMRTPARRFWLGSGAGAYWMVAAGHTVWLEVSGDHPTSALWRLNGPTATPTTRPTRLPAEPGCGDSGEGPAHDAGNEKIGIYCAGNGSSAVTQIDPTRGLPRTVATLKLPNHWDSPQAVAFDGSVFFLDPATFSFPGHNALAVIQTHSVLYGVTARSAIALPSPQHGEPEASDR